MRTLKISAIATLAVGVLVAIMAIQYHVNAERYAAAVAEYETEQAERAAEREAAYAVWYADYEARLDAGLACTEGQRATGTCPLD